MCDKTFRAWEIDQAMLFPPSVRDYVPEGHLVHFIRDLVRKELDLSAIFARYTERSGQPPYHPALMTALLLYSYSRGIYSSRRIELACTERVDFMSLTAHAVPDHSTICQFRVDHLEALSQLFVQVLSLCRDAGMVKLGHVALDGTKMKANASKHAAMSYRRMVAAEPELARIVDEWMKTAKTVDEEEDEENGKGLRGDEIPEHVKAKLKKLLAIREAKARLEKVAEEKAARLKKEREEKEKAAGRKLGGTPPKALDGEPEDKAQSNFTDPESRIMKTRNGYEQAYNCQAGVDDGHQVIVTKSVANRQNDEAELLPLLDAMEETLGEYPDEASADTGYCSERNLAGLRDRLVRGYVTPGRIKHGEPSVKAEEKGGPLTKEMRARLRRGGFRSRYRLRKQVVEPVFGQIKEARGFRQFLLRGIEKVELEWSLLCTVHNLLKLAAVRLAPAK